MRSGDQEEVKREVDRVGHPHGDHARQRSSQTLQVVGDRVGHQIHRHGQGKDLGHPPCPCGQYRLQSQDPQQGRRQGEQGQGSRHADPCSIDHAPAQHRARPVQPAFADGAGGHHLDAVEQAHRGGQHHRRRRPAQGVEAKLSRREAPDHDGIGQAHGHDAQARADDRRRQGDQFCKAAHTGTRAVRVARHVRGPGPKGARNMPPPACGRKPATSVWPKGTGPAGAAAGPARSSGVRPPDRSDQSDQKATCERTDSWCEVSPTCEPVALSLFTSTH